MLTAERLILHDAPTKITIGHQVVYWTSATGRRSQLGTNSSAVGRSAEGWRGQAVHLE